MSKKIIFVGPPNAGKTTLRKIFFEGENRIKLLKFGLEPTHGQESVILKICENVGIFDLAGQENWRWLETDEKSVFYNTKILIIVIDITTSIKEILEFIEKVLKIKDELTPSTYIYLLLHKKDLITQDRLADIKLGIIKKFGRENQIKIAYTSIMKKYFLEMLSLFMEILKTCTSKLIDKERVNFDLLKITIDLLYFIHEEIVISKMDLIKKLKVSDKKMDYIMNVLDNEGFIKVSKAQNLPLYSLTVKGKKYFNDISRDFFIDSFNVETNLLEANLKGKLRPPLLGFMVADKDGKTLMTTELYDDIFGEILNSKNDEIHTDHELIPMFICALERFSGELNIQNLSGFKLKGTNIRLQTYRYDIITVTLFINGRTNIRPIKDQIKDWFDNFFKKYEKEFESSIISCNVSRLVELREEGREWLVDLNQKYQKLAVNIEIFDFRQATELYEKLEDISQNVNVNYSTLIQKVKTLKTNLMNAVYDENFKEIRDIANVVHNLKV